MDDLSEFAELARRGVLWWSRHGVRSSLDRVADWLADDRGPSMQSYAMWSAGRATSPCPRSTLAVSIIVPVLDPEPEHLLALVASVQEQSHQAWELLLVDDGSERADVRELLDDLAGRDQRIRLLRRPGPVGPPARSGISAASQRGVAAAQGEVLLFADHDDELGAEMLGPLAWAFERDELVDLVYTDEDQITPRGRYVAPVFKPGPSPWLALGFNYVTHAMALRRRLYDALGGLRDDYDGAQDHDLLLRAFEVARSVVHLPLLGYHWRRTRRSVAASTTAKPWAFKAGGRAIEDACRRRRLPLGQAVPASPPGVWRLEWQALRTPRPLSIVLHGDPAGWSGWRAFLFAAHELVEVVSLDEGRMPENPGPGDLLLIDGCLKPDLRLLQEALAWSALPGVLATAAGGELAGRRMHLGYGIDRQGLALPIEPGLHRRAVGPGLLGAAPREVATSGDQLLLLNGALESPLRRLANQPVTRPDLLCLALAAAAAGAPTLHLPRTGARLGSRPGPMGHPVFLDESRLWPAVAEELPESFWRGGVDRFCPRHELLTELGLPAPLGPAVAQPASWSNQTTV